ncbi:MAG: hypothetical protein ABSE92_15640 [Terriglobales bacterium]|jgi:hypothetical protein
MDLLEEEGILERKCTGMSLITCGKLLLWIDLMLVLTFLMPGLRDGSSLWTWWIAVEAVVGFSLIGVGLHLRGTVYE